METADNYWTINQRDSLLISFGRWCWVSWENGKLSVPYNRTTQELKTRCNNECDRGRYHNGGNGIDVDTFEKKILSAF